MKTMQKKLKSEKHAYNLLEDRFYSDEFELEAHEDELFQNFESHLSNTDTQSSLKNASSSSQKIYTNSHLLSRYSDSFYDYKRAVDLTDMLHKEIEKLIFK